MTGIPCVFTLNEDTKAVVAGTQYMDAEGALQDYPEDGSIVKIVPGAEAFGDYNWIIHNLRLPTLANTNFWSTTKSEMPVVGGEYDQIIVRMCKERDGIAGGALGMRVTTVTTHVFYVLRSQSQFIMDAFTTIGVPASKQYTDADDELAENALLIMMQEVESHPEADIIDFCGYVRCKDQLHRRFHPIRGWVKNPYRALYFRQISPSCGHAIIRSNISKSNLYDEKIRRFEDYELELRLIRNAKIYSSQYVTEIHNVDFAEASSARKNICEDFLGHLCFSKGDFWYKMCLYRFFVEERPNYPMACRDMYPALFYRYDLLLLHKILLKIEKLFR
jgi:hypothetical protein